MNEECGMGKPTASNGFNLAAPGTVNPINVNYDYTTTGAALTLNLRLQNMATCSPSLH